MANENLNQATNKPPVDLKKMIDDTYSKISKLIGNKEELANMQRSLSQATKEKERLQKYYDKQVSPNNDILTLEEQEQVTKILQQYYPEKEIKGLKEAETIRLIRAILLTERFATGLYKKTTCEEGQRVTSARTINASKTAASLTDADVESFKSFIFFFDIAKKQLVTEMLEKAVYKPEDIENFYSLANRSEVRNTIIRESQQSEEVARKLDEIFFKYYEFLPPSLKHHIKEGREKDDFIGELFYEEQWYKQIDELSRNYYGEGSINERVDTIREVVENLKKKLAAATAGKQELQRKKIGKLSKIVRDAERVSNRFPEILKEYFPNFKDDEIDGEISLLNDDQRMEMQRNILFRKIDQNRLNGIFLKVIPYLSPNDDQSIEDSEKEKIGAILQDIFNTALNWENTKNKKNIQDLSYDEKKALANYVLGSKVAEERLTDYEKGYLLDYLKRQYAIRDELAETTRALLSHFHQDPYDIKIFDELNDNLKESLLHQRIVANSRGQGLNEEDKAFLNKYVEKYAEKTGGVWIHKDLAAETQKQITNCEAKINKIKEGLEKFPGTMSDIEKEEIYERGHLIKLLQQYIAKEHAAGNQAERHEKLFKDQIKTQKETLKKRIERNKTNPKNSISEEIFLKAQRAKISFIELQASTEDNRQKLIAESIDNTISTLGSVSKLPVVGVTKTIRGGALTVAVLALSLPYLRSTLAQTINPNSPYTGKRVTNIMEEARNMARPLTDQLEEIENGIRRM